MLGEMLISLIVHCLLKQLNYCLSQTDCNKAVEVGIRKRLLLANFHNIQIELFT